MVGKLSLSQQNIDNSIHSRFIVSRKAHTGLNLLLQIRMMTKMIAFRNHGIISTSLHRTHSLRTVNITSKGDLRIACV